MTSDYAGFTVNPERATQKLLLADTDCQLVNAPTCTGEDMSAVLFWPSRPLPPDPHDHKVPLVLIAAQKLSPADTDDQSVNAPTCIGEDVVVVLFDQVGRWN